MTRIAIDHVDDGPFAVITRPGAPAERVRLTHQAVGRLAATAMEAWLVEEGICGPVNHKLSTLVKNDVEHDSVVRLGGESGSQGEVAMISVSDAARYICERGEWRVTNLKLQKILYLAHMAHLGWTGKPLIDGRFEAWAYGPVEPDLYRRVRMFGANPIQDIFFDAVDVAGREEERALNAACEDLIRKSPGELVSITHWNKGAWAKNYTGGERGIVIPQNDILEEYRARMSD